MFNGCSTGNHLILHQTAPVEVDETVGTILTCVFICSTTTCSEFPVLTVSSVMLFSVWLKSSILCRSRVHWISQKRPARSVASKWTSRRPATYAKWDIHTIKWGVWIISVRDQLRGGLLKYENRVQPKWQTERSTIGTEIGRKQLKSHGYTIIPRR